MDQGRRREWMLTCQRPHAVHAHGVLHLHRRARGSGTRTDIIDMQLGLFANWLDEQRNSRRYGNPDLVAEKLA
eukprot:4072234-Pyramimonas_sp.AAC.1